MSVKADDGNVANLYPLPDKLVLTVLHEGSSVDITVCRE